MAIKPETPLSIRVNAEDTAALNYLCDRLGSTKPQVIRLAIRRLQEQEAAVAKTARKTR